MNKVILVGNLARDVDLRYLPSGAAVATFGLATNRSWKDKTSGEKKQEVMFIDIKMFGRSAEIANQYLAKGKKVLIEGRLQLEQWQDQNGQNRTKHSIFCESFEFLDSKNENSGAGMNSGYNNAPNSYDSQPSQMGNQQGGQNYNSSNNFSNPTSGGNTMSGASGTPNFEIDDDDIPF